MTAVLILNNPYGNTRWELSGSYCFLCVLYLFIYFFPVFFSHPLRERRGINCCHFPIPAARCSLSSVLWEAALPVSCWRSAAVTYCQPCACYRYRVAKHGTVTDCLGCSGRTRVEGEQRTGLFLRHLNSLGNPNRFATDEQPDKFILHTAVIERLISKLAEGMLWFKASLHSFLETAKYFDVFRYTVQKKSLLSRSLRRAALLSGTLFFPVLFLSNSGSY